MKRYKDASVDPPVLLYVDRDCCSGKSKALFAEWDNLLIRLDIYHFMCRIATGCSTESHQLHQTFMARLSQCIFQWDSNNLERPKLAKKRQMESQGIKEPGDRDALSRITSREFALHCRRTTRSTKDIVRNITNLIEFFDGEQGRDTLGVPLFNSRRIWEEWEKGKRARQLYPWPTRRSALYGGWHNHQGGCWTKGVPVRTRLNLARVLPPAHQSLYPR